MRINETKQSEVVRHIQDTFSNYETQSKQWRDRMTRIYKSISTFDNQKLQPRETTFKVNKAHEIENRILPRIMSKQPKPIVSYCNDDYLSDPSININELTDAIEDRLENIYEKQDMIESLRHRARAWVRYWMSFAKLSPKYRIKRTPENKEEIVLDEMGNEVPQITKRVKEEVYEQYTGIDIKSRTDIYFDPRYTRLEDMPSIIDITRNARLSYFTRNKSKFMNIDKLIQCCVASKERDFETYKNRIETITGTQLVGNKMIRPDTLDVKCYYGYYDLSDEPSMVNEKLYEFRTVDDVLLVYAKEISTMPFEDFRVFEDTETFFATGFIEPILWMQDELNRKKNRASEYVNKILKPDYLYSPLSWIDPRKVNQWHWNIIVTPYSVQQAKANFEMMDRPELNSSYFQEQNDFERQIQAATFTINTNTPLTQQSLTNTATWAKIQSFETDAVTGQVRKNFEESLVRLSYKILQFEFDNASENIKIKSRDEEDTFREINKEALRDAVDKYEIKIEAWSSSFDSEEARRNDAIAQWNIALQAKQAWLPVNLKKLFENIIKTFPQSQIKDLFDNAEQMQAMMWLWAPQPIEQQPQAPSTMV